jgi:hypothetical protein
VHLAVNRQVVGSISTASTIKQRTQQKISNHQIHRTPK